MQLSAPPTARGFLIPWQLTEYSWAVLRQEVSQWLDKKKSIFCGFQYIDHGGLTEVWIYASTWKNDWKKDVQELCYKATATGLPASFMGGMPCGTARGPMMAAAMGLPMGMQAGMGLGGMACPGMPVMGCASGLFGAPAGVFPNMLGPACPAMMDGAPISWSHRPLPVLTDRQPAAQTTASAAAAAALAAAPPVATSRPIPAV